MMILLMIIAMMIAKMTNIGTNNGNNDIVRSIMRLLIMTKKKEYQNDTICNSTYKRHGEVVLTSIFSLKMF